MLLLLTQAQQNFGAIIGAGVTIVVALIGAYVRLRSNQERLYAKQVELTDAQKKLFNAQAMEAEEATEAERFRLVERLQRYLRTIDDERESNRLLTERLTVQEGDLVVLKQRANRLEADLVLSQADRKDLHTELAACDTRVQEAEAELVQLHSELDACNTRVREAEAELAQLSSELARLHAALHEAEDVGPP